MVLKEGQQKIQIGDSRKLSILDKIIIEDSDIKEINNLIRIFQKYKIHEVYNLAAQSFVKSSFDNPIETSQVNAFGTLNLLEIIRNQNKNIKFYQASTSEMFGKHGKKQNELTNFHPEVLMPRLRLFHIILCKIIEKLIKCLL